MMDVTDPEATREPELKDEPADPPIETVMRSCFPGGVIATLQADLPTLFDRDISYDIYAPDIYFRDPVNTFKSKFNYRIIFWTLRFHARLFFTQIYFDLHTISQPTPNQILAIWTVRGTLKVPWRAKIFFNGTSTYDLNSDGLIDRHIDTWDRSPKEILRQFFKKTGDR